MHNTLYYGENLSVLREHVPDESVDLIYLDPPFNFSASYNVLFKEKTGEESPAQIKAFTDMWEWTQETERVYEREIIPNPHAPAAVNVNRDDLGIPPIHGRKCDDGRPTRRTAPRVEANW
jgi:DNA modification methylase